MRGVPVPPARVVSRDLFEEVLVAEGLWSAAQTVFSGGDAAERSALQEAILAMTLPPWLVTALHRAVRVLGGRVAVRSSALGEDGHEHSFAGQLQTVLNVSQSGVETAVKRCWASLFGQGVASYRHGKGADADRMGMGVIVQQMVDPWVSGVMFTVNPVNGSWREMTIESVFGLCEGVVSGRLAPHWFLVRRPRRVPRPVQRVLARVRLQVVQRDIHPLTHRFGYGEAGGVVLEETPEEWVDQPTMTTQQVIRLCRLGLRLERLLGEPQDVEWALNARGRFVVLQARPITAGIEPRARKDVLWTRRFLGERWPEMATPLGWSIIAPLLEEYIGYQETQERYLGGGPALRLIRSRPYLNASVFPHLAFKMPGMPAPHFLMELLAPDEQNAWKRRFAVTPDWSVYGSILKHTLLERRWRRFRWNPFTNHLAWQRFEEELVSSLPGVSRQPTSRMDAIAMVDMQIALIRRYVGVHVCSLLFANIWNQVLEGLLAMWVPEEAAALHRALATCPRGNRTLECNQALWELAWMASDDDLRSLELGDDLEESVFSHQLEGFLERFGHRSDASWEIFTSRWRENPAQLVPLLVACRLDGAEAPAPRIERQQQAYERAVVQLERRIPNRAQRHVLTRVIALTRAYLLLRENQRFHFEHLQACVQRTIEWLGARLVKRGVLPQGADLALLTFDEVKGLVDGSLSGEDAVQWMHNRSLQRETDRDLEMADFLRGEEALEGAGDGVRLEGLGISTGRVSGRVRRLRSPAEGAKLQAGDILVARSVDPVWTSLFANVGGVVLELGSRLSHGAVVAREYQLPAVVNIEGAMRKLTDGQEVTVDGTRGLVWIHPDSARCNAL